MNRVVIVIAELLLFQMKYLYIRNIPLLRHFIPNNYLVIRLLAAVDPIKDQTFFLSTLTQSQLRRSMFPVGSLTKKQVRQIAVDVGMAEIAEKPEVSFRFAFIFPFFCQEICGGKVKYSVDEFIVIALNGNCFL